MSIMEKFEQFGVSQKLLSKRFTEGFDKVN